MQLISVRQLGDFQCDVYQLKLSTHNQFLFPIVFGIIFGAYRNVKVFHLGATIHGPTGRQALTTAN